jgi:hypothetical protein
MCHGGAVSTLRSRGRIAPQTRWGFCVRGFLRTLSEAFEVTRRFPGGRRASTSTVARADVSGLDDAATGPHGLLARNVLLTIKSLGFLSRIDSRALSLRMILSSRFRTSRVRAAASPAVTLFDDTSRRPRQLEISSSGVRYWAEGDGCRPAAGSRGFSARDSRYWSPGKSGSGDLSLLPEDRRRWRRRRILAVSGGAALLRLRRGVGEGMLPADRRFNSCERTPGSAADVST